MRRSRLWLLLLLAPTLVLAGGAPAGLGARVVEMSFRSRAVGDIVRMEVYLPAGYATSGKRYPVIYFLHGLPASSTSYRGVDHLRAALDRSGRPTILVAPQGARDHDSDPEYLDWGPGRNWESAVGRELPHFVDRTFRTIANRPRFRAENLRLHRELLAAGVPHLFRLYPGAHAQTVWSAHATAWLGLALTHLEGAV